MVSGILGFNLCRNHQDFICGNRVFNNEIYCEECKIKGGEE